MLLDLCPSMLSFSWKWSAEACSDLYAISRHKWEIEGMKLAVSWFILNLLRWCHFNFGHSIRAISLWRAAVDALSVSLSTFWNVYLGELLCVNLGSFSSEGKKNVLCIILNFRFSLYILHRYSYLLDMIFLKSSRHPENLRVDSFALAELGSKSNRNYSSWRWEVNKIRQRKHVQKLGDILPCVLLA